MNEPITPIAVQRDEEPLDPHPDPHPDFSSGAGGRQRPMTAAEALVVMALSAMVTILGLHHVSTPSLLELLAGTAAASTAVTGTVCGRLPARTLMTRLLKLAAGAAK